MKKPRKYSLPELMTQSAAAHMIGVSRQAIPAMIGRGQLDAVMVAGTPFVVKASARRLAAERAAKKSAA
jgi:hypothetical protein